MNDQVQSVEALLARIESEFEIADGRVMRLRSDAHGSYSVVDGTGRAVPLAEFTAECASRARMLQAREVGAQYRRIVAGMREIFARLRKDARQAPANTARA
jgi:hypothetical protein